tara:strand:+ start:8446 stop:9075 length:630 start_codon:yes stop_codon:yes gene_type:complete
MAITTYSELQSSIAKWLNRDGDTPLLAVIPDFISLAEADINRKLRHYKMIERVDAVLDSRYVQVPNNWMETVRFNITAAATVKLDLIGPEDMLEKRQNNNDTTGIPRYYTQMGDAIEVFPTPAAEYAMQLAYYSKVPNLSDSVTFNWLLQDQPDVYLYGALMQSAPYLLDDARTQTWASLYQNGLTSSQKASDDTRFGGSGRRIIISSY